MTEFHDMSVLKNPTLISEVKNQEYCQDYKHPLVAVSQSILISNQKALIAKGFIPADTLIYTYGAPANKERTRTSIQVSMDHHLEAGSFASYTNHSCSPNAALRTSYSSKDNMGKVALITIKNINKGEELTFDYATTETELTQELMNTECLCKSSLCRKKMMSFPDLSKEEQLKLFSDGLLSDHIVTHFFQNSEHA